MTKRQAIVVCAVVSCLVTWGGVFLLGTLGAGDGVQLTAAMLGLIGSPVAGSLTFVHYTRRPGERR
jgi:Flp pilus assembly protein protease CpaA